MMFFLQKHEGSNKKQFPVRELTKAETKTQKTPWLTKEIMKSFKTGQVQSNDGPSPQTHEAKKC